MFSLLHYIPKASFTRLILPKTHFVLSESHANVKTVTENVILKSGGTACVKRTHEYKWVDDYFTVNFSTNTDINHSGYDISEDINVNMKNYTGIVIKLDYYLQILDGKDKHIHRLYNFEYDFSINNLVELDKFYSKDIYKIYNELKHIK
jgi:hypothetical protein